MIPRSLRNLSLQARRLLAPAAVGAILLTGCSGVTTTSTDATGTTATSSDTTSTDADADADATTTATTATAATTDASTASSVDVDTADLGAVGTLASSEVHDIAIELDQAEYEAMVTTYNSTGEKEWIEATVTIDGQTFEHVGLRLKGNSSLRGITTDDDPATVPWLIELDKFVDGQNLDGLTEFVVRSSSTETSLNEAVALELLDLAGLASQDAVAVRFSVNGGEQVLRLVIDNPEDEWMAEEFDDTGALYKAESTGDWSYRGDDPESYDDVFDQEAGEDNADLTPLIDFLQFVNESDDATFDAELSDWLDVDSFATYLAMQELLDNFDDINGPGNNAYLYYDTETEQFTVVPWDYNLAFGQSPGGMGGGNGGGQRPGGGMGQPPAMGGQDTGGGQGPGGGMGGGAGGMNRDNPLVDRFLANDEWNALYQAKLEELRAALYDSGVAQDVLDAWTSVVTDSGLVDQSTIDTEASAISTTFS